MISKKRCIIAKFEIFSQVSFHFKLSQISWQLEAVQTIVSKADKSSDDHSEKNV